MGERIELGSMIADVSDAERKGLSDAAEGASIAEVMEHLRAEDGVALDHVGIAVRSIQAAREFYETLGLTVTREEKVEDEAVRAAMVPLGETRLELLEATAEDSTIGRFVAKRGEGLHHIAVRVGDVDAAFARMRAGGVRLVSDGVRVGAGGHRYFFVHPASAGGVLVEVVGEGGSR
jgi:GTPase